MKNDTLTVRIDTEKKKLLDSIAASMDRDRSYILNEAVDDYIDLHQWQLAHIQKGIDAANQGKFATEEEVQKAFQRWRS